MSRTNLEGRFKEELGYSADYEIKNRIKLTCSLLANTEIKMSSVYEMCGYPSLQYMHTVFSKETGTPQEYRVKHNKNLSGK